MSRTQSRDTATAVHYVRNGRLAVKGRGIIEACHLYRGTIRPCRCWLGIGWLERICGPCERRIGRPGECGCCEYGGVGCGGIDGQHVFAVGSCRKYPKLIFVAGGRTGCCTRARCRRELWCQLPTTPPTTAPMIIRIRRGIPTLIPVLAPFFDGGRPAI
jgi:hypothetical protein